MLRAITIAILLLLCSACSRTEFAYRNADWLLEYYAWKALKTNAVQRDHWQPVVQSTLRHHREQELPLVIAWLNLAERSTRKTAESAGTACLLDSALLLYQRHARLAVELATPLLAELGAAQIRHLEEYMRERQQDDIELYLNPDPQRRKVARQQRITERIENWTGKLNDSQHQLINNTLSRIPDLSPSWLDYRAQQTGTLLTILSNGADAEELRAYLYSWWVYRDGITTETREDWQVARQEFIQLMDKLATSLSTAQRTTLENRLIEMREALATFVLPEPVPVNLPDVPACASPTG
jgi:hypothetical protein